VAVVESLPVHSRLRTGLIIPQSRSTVCVWRHPTARESDP